MHERCSTDSPGPFDLRLSTELPPAARASRVPGRWITVKFEDACCSNGSVRENRVLKKALGPSRGNENLQGLIEFRSRFASRSFTRDWLTVRTVIHGFSHFNYAMLHHGALYLALLHRVRHVFVARFHHAELERPLDFCSPLSPSKFLRPFSPRLRPLFLLLSPTSAPSFRHPLKRAALLDLPSDGFGTPIFPNLHPGSRPRIAPALVSPLSLLRPHLPHRTVSTCATASSKLHSGAHFAQPRLLQFSSPPLAIPLRKGNGFFREGHRGNDPSTDRRIDFAADAGNCATVLYESVLARLTELPQVDRNTGN